MLVSGGLYMSDKLVVCVDPLILKSAHSIDVKSYVFRFVMSKSL